MARGFIPPSHPSFAFVCNQDRLRRADIYSPGGGTTVMTASPRRTKKWGCIGVVVYRTSRRKELGVGMMHCTLESVGVRERNSRLEVGYVGKRDGGRTSGWLVGVERKGDWMGEIQYNSQ